MTKLLCNACASWRDYVASTIRSYVQIVEAFRRHAGARLDPLTPAQPRR